jgi:hypothetical protein
MTKKHRAIALLAASIALMGLCTVPSRAAQPPAAPLAPLNVNGRHVFWANGVRTVASSSPSDALNNLIYHGGAVQTAPKVYLTFWGKEWSDPSSAAYTIPVKDPTGKNYTLGRLRTYLTNLFTGIGGTGWNNIQTQYCQGGQIGDLSCASSKGRVTNTGKVLAGTWTDTLVADEPGPVIDTLGLVENISTDPVATEALKASKHFNSTDTNATFFVFAPPGRVVTGSQPFGAYCGYHSEVTPASGAAHGLRYAFIPYILDADLSQTSAIAGCGMNFVNKTNTVAGNGVFDGFSMVSGHEYAEAVTDPDAWPTQDGWNDIQTSENGDKCAWITPSSPPTQGQSANLTLRTGKFAMQSMWSNAFAKGTGGCVMTYP